MAITANRQIILLVGIIECDGLCLGRILLDSKWQSHGVGTCQQALDFLDRNHVSVVVTERELPDGSWIELLNSMANLSAAPSLIVSSRLADHRLWAEVLSLGGFDVLMTPFETEEVLRVIPAAHRDWGSKQVEERGRAAKAGSC